MKELRKSVQSGCCNVFVYRCNVLLTLVPIIRISAFFSNPNPPLRPSDITQRWACFRDQLFWFARVQHLEPFTKWQLSGQSQIQNSGRASCNSPHQPHTEVPYKCSYKVQVQIQIWLPTDQAFQLHSLVRQTRGRDLGMA